MFAKSLFDILIKEGTTTWFDDHNNNQERREFVFYLNEMNELLLCGLARAAEDFNKASCLQLALIQHVDKNDYEKVTMNMADDIKEVKKMIRKNTACTTRTKFSTVASSTKMVRIKPNLQLKDLAHVKVGAKSAKDRKPAGAWTPPAWAKQADGYNATRRNLPSIDEGESKKKGSLPSIFFWQGLRRES